MEDEIDREYQALLREGEPQPPVAKPRKKRAARKPPFYPDEPPIFDCGDVVCLHSGGPAMTVWKPEPAIMSGLWPWMYWCHWFHDGKLRDQRFPGHVLKKVELSEAP